MNLKSKICYGIGNIGQAAFYNAFSTFLLIYVSTSMVHSLTKKEAAFVIGLVTTMVVIIRVVEILLDPLIGNIIDNTKTRFGKFKPWQLIGGISSSLMMIPLFNGTFGLFESNLTLYIISFIVIFFFMDITYSFRDISYWGMIPAISTSSYERGKYTSIATFTGAVGWNGIAALVIPIVTYASLLLTGNQDISSPAGWAFFGYAIAALGIITCVAVALGTKESDSSIRIQNEKITLKDVFKVIAKNDQLLWNATAYILYALSSVITGGVLFYYFKYILNNIGAYPIVGILGMIFSFISAPLFVMLNKYISRRYLFMTGICMLFIAFLLFLLVPFNNIFLGFIPVFLFSFPQIFIQITAILTFTDSIEYGQLKTGVRNEAVILSIRPMLDKLAGAFSNGIIGFIIVAANMAGDVTYDAITSRDTVVFSIYAFAIPLLLILISGFIFWRKVKLDEKAHAKILEKL